MERAGGESFVSMSCEGCLSMWIENESSGSLSGCLDICGIPRKESCSSSNCPRDSNCIQIKT